MIHIISNEVSIFLTLITPNRITSFGDITNISNATSIILDSQRNFKTYV